MGDNSLVIGGGVTSMGDETCSKVSSSLNHGLLQYYFAPFSKAVKQLTWAREEVVICPFFSNFGTSVLAVGSPSYSQGFGVGYSLFQSDFCLIKDRIAFFACCMRDNFSISYQSCPVPSKETKERKRRCAVFIQANCCDSFWNDPLLRHHKQCRPVIPFSDQSQSIPMWISRGERSSSQYISRKGAMILREQTLFCENGGNASVAFETGWHASLAIRIMCCLWIWQVSSQFDLSFVRFVRKERKTHKMCASSQNQWTTCMETCMRKKMR